MRRTAAFASLLVALTTSACQDPITEPAPLSLETTQSLTLSEGAEILVDRNPLSSEALISHLTGSPAINPADYACATTDISNWINGRIAELLAANRTALLFIYNSLGGSFLPTYEALYIATEATPQYFGYNGEYTEVLQETHRDAKRFWNIESSDIQLIGMHGSVMTDTARMAAAYRHPFILATPLSPANAQIFAAALRNAVLAFPELNGGDHALFSFNAFAFSWPGVVPDKIVMGDGMLEGYAALGFADVAPQAVYAHEFAHHIQFENEYFNDPIVAGATAPERTRYTELMADAYSAYYLTHKRGLAMNKHRVAQFLVAFFQIGDCQFTNPGHHGTPNQRMRAAQFGFDVADQARKQGHILTSEAFHDLFVAKYPELIAPDAI